MSTAITVKYGLTAMDTPLFTYQLSPFIVVITTESKP